MKLTKRQKETLVNTKELMGAPFDDFPDLFREVDKIINVAYEKGLADGWRDHIKELMDTNNVRYSD